MPEGTLKILKKEYTVSVQKMARRVSLKCFDCYLKNLAKDECLEKFRDTAVFWLVGHSKCFASSFSKLIFFFPLDMEFAQHTLSFSRENLLDSGNNGSNENSGGNFSTSPQPNPADPLMDNLSEQLRRQKLSDVLSVNGGAAGVSTAAGNNGKLRILAFAKKAAAAEEGHLNNLKVALQHTYPCNYWQ